MATKEHKECAQVLKRVHSSLRKSSKTFGPDVAWSKHISEEKTLKLYADAMKILGTRHWEKNAADPNKTAVSRISWIIDYCHKYYFEGGQSQCRSKELKIADKLNIHRPSENYASNEVILKVLDVGSCYNPLGSCPFMDVLPVDLYPASDSDVLVCDFLGVEICEETVMNDGKVYQLARECYDVVVFSLLLEYLPASIQRKLCCEKAYKLLKWEGILLIITPDSKHVGANAKIMKNWRYVLAVMGFSRVCYEKLSYLHCMAFRKSQCPSIPRRWADLYREPYMEDEIFIPQDLQTCDNLRHEETSGLIQTSDSELENTIKLFCYLPNDFS